MADAVRAPVRTGRDRIVDIACVAGSAVGGAATLLLELRPFDTPAPIGIGTDIALGVAASAAIWFRRRRPVGVALLLLVPMALSSAAQVACLIALITVAVHRRAGAALTVAALQMVAASLYLGLRPTTATPLWADLLSALVLTAAVVAWGMYLRARRQLVASLRERAERAESEQQLRAEQARHAERARIAREMHDVLGHRMSLIALQAGGLEVGAGLTPEQRTTSAGQIREAARQALVDLRDVVGVLGEDAGEPVPQAPQPSLRDVVRLVDDSRTAGADVRLDLRVDDPDAVPGPLARAAYRIVQESLTNVHKHARGTSTVVLLHGAPGTGLRVSVRNRLPVAVTPSWPGGGRGLIGLAERVDLAGGTLTHGPDPAGDFVVDARLRWTT